MTTDKKERFDGNRWARKKGIDLHNWKNKMDSMEKRIRNKIVLDAGCGDGEKIDYFYQRAKEIYGIDINKDDLREAKEKYRREENIHVVNGSVEDIPFDSATFDVVYSCWVIEHLKKPDIFLDEVYRILKPGGLLILWVPNVKNISGFLTKIIPLTLKVKILSLIKGESSEGVSHHKCYYRANSVKRIERKIKDKFRIVKINRYDGPGTYQFSRLLTYLWFIRHKLTDNRLLRWMHKAIYIELKKIG